MSLTDSDIRFMKRAVELSQKGKFATRPNPMVGAVIDIFDKCRSKRYVRIKGFIQCYVCCAVV